MKIIKRISKVFLTSLLAYLVYSHQALADLAPIDFYDKGKNIPKSSSGTKIEPVNFYQYTLAQLEWYHFIIIGVCLGVLIGGGIVLIHKAKNRSKDEQGSDKI